MASEWEEVQLQNIVTKLGDGLHGTPKYSEEGKYFFINGNNLSNGNIVIKSETKRVSDSEYEKHKKNLNNRTLLVSINGTIGNIAYYKNEPVILGKSACYFNLKDDVSRKFIRYILSSSSFLHYLESFATGTTIKNVSLKMMREFEFPLPPLPEQKAIAHILGSLDDKIELNRRMNATLEGMAQALFQSWFVDFDPVLDNALAAGNPIPDELTDRAEIRRQAIDNGTANREAAQHFPATFQFTEELGWIPEGWEAGKLSDLLEVKYGKDHKKLADGIIPVYGSGGLMRYADKSLYTGESVLIPRKGTLSNILYLNEEFWTVDTMFYTIPKSKLAPKYTFHHLKRLDFTSMNVGSAVPSMTTKVLNELPILLPDDTCLLIFDSILTSYFDKQDTNNAQVMTLTILRDTILPKLISGEMRLLDKEQLFEDSVG